MGIPAYFSHIIKNHSNIIKNISTLSNLHNLYLDCNSIIYDAYYGMDCNNKSIQQIENELIKSVCQKLHYYIDSLKPTDTTFIAFDGVAPVAKLEQQRTRRIKSEITNKIINKINNKTNPSKWSTVNITPGTEFMKKLGFEIKTYFKTKKLCKNIITSCSDEPGEGEHKLFQYIRNNIEYHKDKNTVIYGLDADLIMLSINHLPIYKNIFLFRETPVFIKQLDSSLDANKLYMINIPELANQINLELNNYKTNSVNRVYDYILLCFFLGNDFMPHFPSINIRTNGIDILLDVYKTLFSNTEEVLYDNKKIVWKNIRKLIKLISEEENNYLINEHKKRDKNEKRFLPTSTPEEKENKLTNIPSFNRKKEKYINPSEIGWQSRYYQILFDINKNNEERIKLICNNYIEALEWTMKYYTIDCPDWRWKYNYDYAPLFEDLIKYIPYFDTTFINDKPINPVSDITQLSYVLPFSCLHLLPQKNFKILTNKYKDWYPENPDFKWYYCKYLWESHIELPEIDLNILENI